MLKNISKLECKVNERIFTSLADTDSSLAEVKESLFQFMKFIGDMEEKAKSNAQVPSNKEPEPEVKAE